MEPKKFYSLSAVARGIGVPKQTIDYAYRNGKLGEKAELRSFTSSGYNFTLGEIILVLALRTYYRRVTPT